MKGAGDAGGLCAGSARKRLSILQGHLPQQSRDDTTSSSVQCSVVKRQNCECFDMELHQRSIPPVPLPRLPDTMHRYLQSARAISTDAEFEVTSACVRSFVTGDGALLQAELFERNRHGWSSSATSEHTSYVKPFWSNMYLGGRYPVPINSNPAIGLAPDPTLPVHGKQAVRAATLICASASWCVHS